MISSAPVSKSAASRFPAWLWLSLLAMILWGAWGIQSKLIMETMTPLANQIVFVVGLVPPRATADRGDAVARAPGGEPLRLPDRDSGGGRQHRVFRRAGDRGAGVG